MKRMNIFDSLVQDALEKNPEYSSLRIVVEKELLHHDILRILDENSYLESLTFIGGTALRACYGAQRLSEDLDFTGGTDFSRSTLVDMGQKIIKEIHEKYGLKVEVSPPTVDKKNVDTWKIKVETRPKKKHIPTQKINIDICAIDSYDTQTIVLKNTYGVNLGSQGLILQVESEAEIFADKLLAFANRPNRLKGRDLWDIVWLYQNSKEPHIHLLPTKVSARKIKYSDFINAYGDRLKSLTTNKQSLQADFLKELGRFLPVAQFKSLEKIDRYWEALIKILEEYFSRIKKAG